MTGNENLVASQYDELGAQYDLLNTLPDSRLQLANAGKIVTSLLSGHEDDKIKVLDLACGSGRYTRKLLDWGATSVLGVDLSALMIKVAKDTTDPALLSQGIIDYIVADGKIPSQYPTGPFDFTYGGWFHACAVDLDEMTRMWENVALNLKPGGYFVGTCAHPTEDPKAYSASLLQKRPMWKGIGNHSFLRDLTDGIEELIVFLPLSGTEEDKQGKKVLLHTYWLKQSIWEEGARRAGFKTPLTWKIPDITEDLVSTGSNSDEERRIWESYKELPAIAIVVAQKAE